MIFKKVFEAVLILSGIIGVIFLSDFYHKIGSALLYVIGTIILIYRTLNNQD